MSARSKARKRALDTLFESEVRGLALDATLQQRLDEAASGERPLNDYTVSLVRGVTEHRDHIDELLTRYSTGWGLDRMPAVDRNALRIGVYEVLYAAEIPDSVAIHEAVALVGELSTDDSPAFVNGILASIVKDKSSLAG